ncbi:hypothetical protein PVAG01_07975 [Phlyctema vagabunda]|uniref:DUF6594 domain-containing protein n=1 Tax=Phlyctema vagabunda TaxID=108571 RepID=A0ABR4PE18_9HELO
MANEGYAKLAKEMSEHGEFAIFRRFRRLNILNLLYMQAELNELEFRIAEKADEDAKIPARDPYSRNWIALAELDTGPHDTEQWEIVLKIRARLKEYNEQLSIQRTLAPAQKPREMDRRFLRQWLKHSTLGDTPIGGDDRNIWHDESLKDDMISIARHIDDDVISRFISSKLVPIFLGLGAVFSSCTRDIEAGPVPPVVHYPEWRIIVLVNMLSTFIASMLPISSITILYFVHDLLDRLDVSIGFTALFAPCLTVATKAERVEVFAATTA